MRLRDQFAGQRFRLNSSLPGRTVAERINHGAGSALWPFTTGVVGGVRSGHIRLRYRSSLFEYNAKPVLAGRIRETPRGSSLDLCYRAPIWLYVFFLFWYFFLAFAAVGFLANAWAPRVTGADNALAAAVLAVLLAAPVGLQAVGTRHSEEELSKLLDFLFQYAEAQP